MLMPSIRHRAPSGWDRVDSSVCEVSDTKKDRAERKSLGPAFTVELPGIEPGSSAALPGLLRVQSAMPLLGSPDLANKSG